jgi:hypothetical protein
MSKTIKADGHTIITNNIAFITHRPAVKGVNADTALYAYQDSADGIIESYVITFTEGATLEIKKDFDVIIHYLADLEAL